MSYLRERKKRFYGDDDVHEEVDAIIHDMQELIYRIDDVDDVFMDRSISGQLSKVVSRIMDAIKEMKRTF